MTQVYAEAAKEIAKVLNSEGGQEILKATPQLVNKSMDQVHDLLKSNQDVQNEIVRKAADKLLKDGGLADDVQAQLNVIAANPGEYSAKIMQPIADQVFRAHEQFLKSITMSVKTGVEAHEDITKSVAKTPNTFAEGVRSVFQTFTHPFSKSDEQRIADAKTDLELERIKQEKRQLQKGGGCDKKTVGRAMLVVLVLFLIVVMYYFMYGGVNARYLTMGLGFAYVALYIYSRYAGSRPSQPDYVDQVLVDSEDSR